MQHRAPVGLLDDGRTEGRERRAPDETATWSETGVTTLLRGDGTGAARRTTGRPTGPRDRR
ncbi:hypothetical protein, partial [Rhodococcus phenolicus]|uniref:hypothetical protein n=1 Tax=Rhodococcus phenolicus TaxID=263849 RepID=UPI001B808342